MQPGLANKASRVGAFSKRPSSDKLGATLVCKAINRAFPKRPGSYSIVLNESTMPSRCRSVSVTSTEWILF